jgi:multimeric flavodoxin WrbA
MPVHLLGISCSPRTDSNSTALLSASLERAAETYGDDFSSELIELRTVPIEACKDCDVCGKRKDDGRFLDCVQKGKDGVQEVLDKMVAADGFVFATPVYFGLPSDLYSRFIMRTRVLRHQDFRLANHVAGVMAIAARRSGGAETTIMATWLPLLRNGCLIVGNGDATCQYGAMAWASGRGHVLTDEWGMEQGYQVVERVYTVARLIKAGADTLGFSSPMTFDYVAGTRP